MFKVRFGQNPQRCQNGVKTVTVQDQKPPGKIGDEAGARLAARASGAAVTVPRHPSRRRTVTPAG